MTRIRQPTTPDKDNYALSKQLIFKKKPPTPKQTRTTIKEKKKWYTPVESNNSPTPTVRFVQIHPYQNEPLVHALPRFQTS